MIRGNHLERNGTGLFFCWGVKYGLAEGNRIEDNRQYGISIGHCDTDNLIVDNTVRRSGKVGVLFRADGQHPFAPHRNRLLRNRIEDSGPDDGVAVDVQGEVEGLVISGNEIVETRGPQRRIGIRVGAQGPRHPVGGQPHPRLRRRSGRPAETVTGEIRPGRLMG